VIDLEQEARAAWQAFAERYGPLFAGFDPGKAVIEVLPPPHRPGPLPEGKQAVFAFFWPDGNVFLYVAYAGPRSGPRFQVQHYSPGGSPSNLAKRLLEAKEALGLETLDRLSVGAWMRQHLARVHFLLPSEWGRDIGKLLKGYLKERWQPLLGG